METATHAKEYLEGIGQAATGAAKESIAAETKYDVKRLTATRDFNNAIAAADVAWVDRVATAERDVYVWQVDHPAPEPSMNANGYTPEWQAWYDAWMTKQGTWRASEKTAADATWDLALKAAKKAFAEAVGDGQITRASELGDALVTEATQEGNAAIALDAADQASLGSALDAVEDSDDAYDNATTSADDAQTTAERPLDRARLVAEGQARLQLVTQLAANQTAYATQTAGREANLNLAQAQLRAGLASSTADAWASVPQNSTVAATWSSYSTAQKELRFRAAEASRQVLWIQQMVTSYPAYVNGMADAAGDENVALTQAQLAQDLAQFDASAAYDDATRPLYHAYDSALRAADKQWARKQRQEEQTRSHVQESEQKTYDIAYATAVKTNAVAEATADRAYYADLYREVAGGVTATQHDEALTQADLAFAESTGNADIAWTTQVAAAGKTKKTTLAAHEKTYKFAVANAQKNLSQGLAYADEQQSIALASMQTTFWAARTSFEGSQHVAEVTASTAFQSESYSGQESAWTAIAAELNTPWASYQADLAAVKSLWSVATAGPNEIAVAASQATARSTYEAAVDTAYEQWATNAAAEQRVLDQALAELTYSRASAEADSQLQYELARATATENYHLELANQRKNQGSQWMRLAHGLPLVPLTTPSNPQDPGWSLFIGNQSVQARDEITLTYQRAESMPQALNTLRGQSSNQSEASTTALLQRTWSQESAQIAEVFLIEEANAYLALVSSASASEAAADTANTAALASMIDALTQNYVANNVSVPWATADAANSSADSVATQLTNAAENSHFVAEASANRTFTVQAAIANRALLVTQANIDAERITSAAAPPFDSSAGNVVALLNATSPILATPAQPLPIGNVPADPPVPLQPLAVNVPSFSFDNASDFQRTAGSLYHALINQFNAASNLASDALPAPLWSEGQSVTDGLVARLGNRTYAQETEITTEPEETEEAPTESTEPQLLDQSASLRPETKVSITDMDALFEAGYATRVVRELETAREHVDRMKGPAYSKEDSWWWGRLFDGRHVMESGVIIGNLFFYGSIDTPEKQASVIRIKDANDKWHNLVYTYVPERKPYTIPAQTYGGTPTTTQGRPAYWKLAAVQDGDVNLRWLVEKEVWEQQDAWGAEGTATLLEMPLYIIPVVGTALDYSKGDYTGGTISLVGDVSLGLGGIAKGLKAVNRLNTASKVARVSMGLDALAIAGQAGLTAKDLYNQDYVKAGTNAAPILFQVLGLKAAAKDLAELNSARHALPELASATRAGRSILNQSCFAAGTPLLTPDGDRLVEHFRVNDLILTRNEHDPDAPLEVRSIEAVFERAAQIFELRIGGQCIRTTAEHPFFVRGKGWQATISLEPGDEILSHDGSRRSVESIAATPSFETVYNVRVTEHHTYFVGSRAWGFSLWAHNSYSVEAATGGFKVVGGTGKKKFDVDGGTNSVLVFKDRVDADRYAKALNEASETAPDVLKRIAEKGGLAGPNVAKTRIEINGGHATIEIVDGVGYIKIPFVELMDDSFFKGIQKHLKEHNAKSAIVEFQASNTDMAIDIGLRMQQGRTFAGGRITIKTPGRSPVFQIVFDSIP